MNFKLRDVVLWLLGLAGAGASSYYALSESRAEAANLALVSRVAAVESRELINAKDAGRIEAKVDGAIERLDRIEGKLDDVIGRK